MYCITDIVVHTSHGTNTKRVRSHHREKHTCIYRDNIKHSIRKMYMYICIITLQILDTYMYIYVQCTCIHVHVMSCDVCVQLKKVSL